jgi:hypothetical protein
MANTFTFDDDEPQSDPIEEAPETTEDESQPEEGEGNNRNFLIIGVVLGGIILLALICGAVYALLILPGRNAAMLSANGTSTANAISIESTSLIQTATQLAKLATPTLSPATDTPKAPSATPLIPSTATFTASPTMEAGTATQQALLTQLAIAQMTTTNQPPSALTAKAMTATQMAKVPRTGFADEVGLPGLFILALVLMAVILLSRRLRQIPIKP